MICLNVYTFCTAAVRQGTANIARFLALTNAVLLLLLLLIAIISWSLMHQRAERETHRETGEATVTQVKRCDRR